MREIQARCKRLPGRKAGSCQSPMGSSVGVQVVKGGETHSPAQARRGGRQAVLGGWPERHQEEGRGEQRRRGTISLAGLGDPL